MAESCRIQKTYLSKVLNHEGHLNEDQLYLALKYLGVNAEEREFTLLLHSWERSELLERKVALDRQINEHRKKHLRTESHLQVDSIQTLTQDLTAYYLDPLFQVIHMYLTLKRFAQAPETIAQVLSLPKQMVQNYLRELEKMEIIQLTESAGEITKAKVLKNNLHLPSKSPLFTAYSARMRMKALERMDRLSSNEAYRFSVMFSSNERVQRKIHESFLEWLKSVQKLVEGSREEDVYQINFDLLSWS